MCGIAGILKLKPSAPFMASSLKKMAGTLKHRGPDDEGYVCFGTSGVALFGGDDTQEASWNIDLPYAAKHNINNCETDFYLGLAHRRLSIIDLSAAGHQPMCNADGTIWLTCNGEIYNYWEIREELEEKSVKFVSGCDVEVLLKAYEYWGMDFLKKLNGMWSFVIYDMRSNLLIGCRDRFGVKPFYYYRSEKMLVFASEQKAITVLPVETSLNPEAVFDYLVNSKVEFKEEGFYKNIKELMPSHYFIYDLNTNHFDITKYYSLNFNNSSEKFDSARFPEIVLQSNEKITSAISLRLRSDVNVGFCLSGGIDSSSIIGVSQKINAQNPLKQLNGNLHAFTAACGDKSCDETGWAEQVVRKNALKWDKYTCSSENLFTELEKIIYYQDSPLYSTSTYAQSSVMKLAKEHGMTILLDGQGGDELFGGYVPFFISYYFELLKKFRLKTFGREALNIKNSPLNYSLMMRLMGKVILNDVLPKGFQKYLFEKNHKEISFLNQDFCNNNFPNESLANGYSSRDMNTALFEYFTQGYLRNLLRWEDRCSMQYSVESRTPFADDTDLIEYVFSLSSAYKIHDGRSKFLLREAMSHVLPEKIYNRTDKLGFSTPQTLWLQQSESRMKNTIHDLAVLDTEKFVDSGKLLKNWAMIFSGNKNPKLMDFSWRYMNFLLWRKINKM